MRHILQSAGIWPNQVVKQNDFSFLLFKCLNSRQLAPPYSPLKMFKQLLLCFLVTGGIQPCFAKKMIKSRQTQQLFSIFIYVICLFIFDCAGSSLLHMCCLQLWRVGAPPQLPCMGFPLQRLFLLPRRLEGTRTQELRHAGLVVLWRVRSSWTRDQTGIPCTARQILSPWTTRKVAMVLFYSWPWKFLSWVN